MAFWSDKDVEPKRKNRWLLYTNLAEPYSIKDVKKPSFTVSSVEHSFAQHVFNWPGKVKWEEVTFTVVDPGIKDKDAAKAFVNKLYDSGYKTPTSFQNAITFLTKKKSVEAIGGFAIHQVDSEGNPLEIWTLHNPFITKVDFGDLNYDGDGDLVTISMSLKYDYAMLNGSKLSGAN